jgi:hypothetical protein
MRKLCVLFATSLLLSSCGPDVDDISKVEFPSNAPSPIEIVSAPVGFAGAVNGLTANQLAEALKKEGFETSIEKRFHLPRVSGKYGNKIKTVYARTDYWSEVTGTASVRNEHGAGQTDKNTFYVRAEVFGNNIINGFMNAKFSDEYSNGPAWLDIAEQIRSDIKQSSFDGFPDNLERDNHMNFEFTPDGVNQKSDADISYSVFVTECVSPYSNNIGLTDIGKEQDSDKLYKNKVCELDIRYNDRRAKGWPDAAEKMLEPELIKLFGEPECFMSDPKCFSEIAPDERKALLETIDKKVWAARNN